MLSEIDLEKIQRDIKIYKDFKEWSRKQNLEFLAMPFMKNQNEK